MQERLEKSQEELLEMQVSFIMFLIWTTCRSAVIEITEYCVDKGPFYQCHAFPIFFQAFPWHTFLCKGLATFFLELALYLTYKALHVY